MPLSDLLRDFAGGGLLTNMAVGKHLAVVADALRHMTLCGCAAGGLLTDMAWDDSGERLAAAVGGAAEAQGLVGLVSTSSAAARRFGNVLRGDFLGWIRSSPDAQRADAVPSTADTTGLTDSGQPVGVLPTVGLAFSAACRSGALLAIRHGLQNVVLFPCNQS